MASPPVGQEKLTDREHLLQRYVCFWPRQTEDTGSPRTALENVTATKAVGTALLQPLLPW